MSEQKLAEVKANRYRFFFDADAGTLTITNQRLHFEADGFGNIHREPEDILLADIVSVTPFNVSLIVPNGIKIRTRAGKEYQYAINKRQPVIDLITSLLPT